jgi:predicted nucleotide-binding protein (sugar kinase/HSP70/actin superfamily)
MWMSVVCGDLCTRFLLKTRPYEKNAGDSDDAFRESVDDFCDVLSRPGLGTKARLDQLRDAVVRTRDRFRAIPANYEKGRPLIGLVGEIFCRLNTFSNDDLARRVEQLGGECWLSDVAEWVWYVNWYVKQKTAREDGRFSLSMIKHALKGFVQHGYEQKLLEPVHDDFRGYEEPHDVREVLDVAAPYLRPTGSIGEMVLSVGKAIYLHGKGADGIIDISPFTCMNGIICEAVYPAVSQAHDEIPIRTFYFDGTNTSIDSDVEIFLELARSYQRRKRHQREYPDYFKS